MWLCLFLVGIPAAEEPAPAVWWPFSEVLAAGTMQLACDASATPASGLVTARLVLRLPEGPQVVSYPCWVPGIHAPGGPVQNLGGFVVRLADQPASIVPWARDPRDPWRFILAVPTGGAVVAIDLTYIANQPTENSTGVDIHAFTDRAVINWNTVLVVPESWSISRTQVAAAIRGPTGWVAASAVLPMAVEIGEGTLVPSTSLETLVDGPVLMAERIISHRLAGTEGGAGEVLLRAAPGGEDPVLDERWVTGMRRVAEQCHLLFGGPYYRRYDFLLVATPEGLGLEHGSCSLNGMDRLAMTSDQADLWQLELMPHEFVHSWVGKHRRPVGMVLDEYHSVPTCEGLWIYEGLTQYLGSLLAVRSGLIDPEQWRGQVATDLRRMATARGRMWRSIRDTCLTSWQLRGWSEHHQDLRRGQDYYIEGALFWLAADLSIRRDTAGVRSLEDVCRAVFGPLTGRERSFTEAEVLATLTAVDPKQDWRAWVRTRIDGIGPFDDGFFQGTGWHMTDGQLSPDDEHQLDLADADHIERQLGLVLTGGWIQSVAAGSLAETAELAAGDYIHSINGLETDSDALAMLKAMLHSPVTEGIHCRVHREGAWRWVTLPYAAGLSATHLERVDGEEDLLAPLVRPLVPAPVPVIP